MFLATIHTSVFHHLLQMTLLKAKLPLGFYPGVNSVCTEKVVGAGWSGCNKHKGVDTRLATW